MLNPANFKVTQNFRMLVLIYFSFRVQHSVIEKKNIRVLQAVTKDK